MCFVNLPCVPAAGAAKGRLKEWGDDFGRNPDRPAGRLVDDGPLGDGPDPNLSILAEEFHVPIEAGSLGGLADPGPSGQHLALEGGAEIVDLVPNHDPDIVVLMGRIGDAVPMGQSDFLNPLDPDRIVDVAELIDRFGRRNDAVLEHWAGHRPALAVP